MNPTQKIDRRKLKLDSREIVEDRTCCITTAYKTIACPVELLNSSAFIATANETQQRISWGAFHTGKRILSIKNGSISINSISPHLMPFIDNFRWSLSPLENQSNDKPDSFAYALTKVFLSRCAIPLQFHTGCGSGNRFFRTKAALARFEVEEENTFDSAAARQFLAKIVGCARSSVGKRTGGTPTLKRQAKHLL